MLDASSGSTEFDDGPVTLQLRDFSHDLHKQNMQAVALMALGGMGESSAVMMPNRELGRLMPVLREQNLLVDPILYGALAKIATGAARSTMEARAAAQAAAAAGASLDGQRAAFLDDAPPGSASALQVAAAQEFDASRFPGFRFFLVLNDPAPSRLRQLAWDVAWSDVVERLSRLAADGGGAGYTRSVIRGFTGKASGSFIYFHGMRLHILMLDDGTAAPLGWPTWRDVRQCPHCRKFYTADGKQNLVNYNRHVAACGPKRRRDGDGPDDGRAAKRARSSM